MSLRARLQGGLAGAACSIALWQVTRRDIGAAHERLAQTMQTHRLVLPRPQTTPEQLPPLKLADAPDWSAETKVDAVRSWNETVRTWHRALSAKLF